MIKEMFLLCDGWKLMDSVYISGASCSTETAMSYTVGPDPLSSKSNNEETF